MIISHLIFLLLQLSHARWVFVRFLCVSDVNSSASEAPEVFPLPESSFLLRFEVAVVGVVPEADADASDSVESGGGIGGGWVAVGEGEYPGTETG